MASYGDKIKFAEQNRDGGVIIDRATDVTQITSITTTVISHGYSGQITTVASTLAANTAAAFTVTNNLATANSIIIPAILDYGGAGVPTVSIDTRAAGSFQIRIVNGHDTAALNALLVIGYVILN